MSADVVHRPFHFKETHATVIAEERYLALAEQSLATAYEDVENYIASQPLFARALEPLPVDMAAPAVVRRMAAAASLAGVGPMAAVAGAIAQVAVEKMLAAGASHVVIDNGGDIVLRIDRPVNIGIFTGSARVRDIALRFEPRPGIFSVCTSSGTVGHSLSFGCADAAVAIADNGCLADAMATALGNRVIAAGEEAVSRAIRASLSPRVEGLLVVAGESLGMGGKLPPIVRATVDARNVSRGQETT